MKFPETDIGRRRFLKAAGLSFAAAALGGGALAAAAFRRPDVKFVEQKDCGALPAPEKKRPSGKRLLVAYASRSGATGGVAKEISDAFCVSEKPADCLLAKHVDSLAPYDSVILGGPIYNGRWLPEAEAFVERHHDRLKDVPVAFFTVGLAMVEDTDAHRREADEAFATVRKKFPRVRPLSVGRFAGAFIPKNLSPFDALTLALTGARVGDHRDFVTIHAWADVARGVFDGIYPAFSTNPGYPPAVIS